MPPTHAKKPAAMKEKCAHGGPLHCSEGCYADGGDVSKGFNGALGLPGIKSSIKNLGSQPPKMMADGGEAEPLDEPMEDDGHEEMESTLAGELLHAMEKKDKKGVVDAIEALVLQCMNKGGM